MERRLAVAEQVATIWWVALTTITITITTVTNITITIIMVLVALVVVVFLLFSRVSFEMCTAMVFLFHYLVFSFSS